MLFKATLSASLLLTLVACGGGGVLPPSGGTPGPVTIPRGSENVTCIPPRGTHITTEVTASVDAQLPRIGRIIRGEGSVSQKAERIQAEVPGLQAFEVLDYRMCVGIANGVVTRSDYNAFLRSIYPQIVLETTSGSPSNRDPEYLRGRRHGQLMRGLVSALQVYEAEYGRYPASLSDVPVTEYISGLGGAEQLRYERDDARGFILRFAGQDGRLDTPDDRIEYGIAP